MAPSVSGFHRHRCQHSRTSSWIPTMNRSHPLPLETLQDQQVGLSKAPFKFLLLPCIPVRVRFCACPFRVASLFPTALWPPAIKTHWFSKSNALGFLFPRLGNLMWAAELSLLWDNFSTVIILYLIAHLEVWDLIIYRQSASPTCLVVVPTLVIVLF